MEKKPEETPTAEQTSTHSTSFWIDSLISFVLWWRIRSVITGGVYEMNSAVK